MIPKKVILAFPGWQNSAARICWENQHLISGAGWEKAFS